MNIDLRVMMCDMFICYRSGWKQHCVLCFCLVICNNAKHIHTPLFCYITQSVPTTKKMHTSTKKYCQGHSSSFRVTLVIISITHTSPSVLCLHQHHLHNHRLQCFCHQWSDGHLVTPTITILSVPTSAIFAAHTYSSKRTEDASPPGLVARDAGLAAHPQLGLAQGILVDWSSQGTAPDLTRGRQSTVPAWPWG